MFNLLKYIYRDKNIYAYSQVIEVLGTHEDITVIPTETSSMFDFQEWLNSIYVGVRSGTVYNEHVFTITKDTQTTLQSQNKNEATTADDC